MGWGQIGRGHFRTERDEEWDCGTSATGPQWEERDEDGDTMGLWHNWTGAEWAGPDVAQRSITKTKNRALYICQRGGHLSKPREREIAGF